MLDMNTLLAEHKCIAIDSCMGTGKTTAILEYIKNEESHRFIFVTPLRTEIKRIIDGTDGKFERPFNAFGSKIDSLHELLREKKDIVMSHVLFTLTTQETIDLIAAGEYVMIIDEAMTLTQMYNDFAAKHHFPVMTSSDIYKILERERLIYIERAQGMNYGQVRWQADEVEDTYLGPVANMANTGGLYCVGTGDKDVNDTVEGIDHNKVSLSKAFIWEFPPAILRAAKNVIALSYLMKETMFDSYLRYHGLEPHYISAKMVGEQKSSFVPYSESKEPKWELVELIDVVTGDANDVGAGRNALSVTWYAKRATDEMLKVLNANNRNVVRRCSAKSSDVIWTAPKAATLLNVDRVEKYNSAKQTKNTTTTRRPVSCPHYDYVADVNTRTKEILESQQQLNELSIEWRKLENMHAVERLEGELLERLMELRDLCEDGPLTEEDFSTWVPCSTKATNRYADRHVCLYDINRFLQPHIADFYEKRGFPINEDVYALSEMIQWIWRSAIRKGEPITVYIPSERMRKLFLDWLGVDEGYYLTKHGEQKKLNK